VQSVPVLITARFLQSLEDLSFGVLQQSFPSVAFSGCCP
jgi:hypothetical protein